MAKSGGFSAATANERGPSDVIKLGLFPPNYLSLDIIAILDLSLSSLVYAIAVIISPDCWTSSRRVEPRWANVMIYQ